MTSTKIIFLCILRYVNLSSTVDFIPHFRNYLREISVFYIHSSIDYWDETRGFPGAIKMQPYNFIVSITPRPFGDGILKPSSFCTNGKYNPYVWRDKSFDFIMTAKGNKRNENGGAVMVSINVMDVWYGFHHLFPEHKKGTIRNFSVSMKMVENDSAKALCVL